MQFRCGKRVNIARSTNHRDRSLIVTGTRKKFSFVENITSREIYSFDATRIRNFNRYIRKIVLALFISIISKLFIKSTEN